MTLCPELGYNLDMIISLGYRVRSGIATRFRIWATERLREYLVKGFTMDDARLKGQGGGNYWKELLECGMDRDTSRCPSKRTCRNSRQVASSTSSPSE